MGEVYFPAVTVCNINQDRKSFFNDINIHNNVTLVDLLYQQFYSGSKFPPTMEKQETIKRNVDEQQLHENWTSYLEEYQVISPKYTNIIYSTIFFLYAQIIICISSSSTIF